MQAGRRGLGVTSVLHVLPKGFVKIRHHGLFAPGNVATKLAAARALLHISPAPRPAEPTPAAAPRDFRELLLALTGVDLHRCSRCGARAVERRPLDPRLLDPPSPQPEDTS